MNFELATLILFFGFLAVFIVWNITHAMDDVHYSTLIQKCTNPYFYYAELQHQNDCDGVGLHPAGVTPK